MEDIISIKDVARLANVSPATVSRVINGTANVSKEKKERVFLAIKETDFKPNEIARALFKQSSKIIGVIVPNIENPFFGEIAKAIEEELYINGYKMLLCNSNDNPKKEIENIKMLIQMNSDGIIIMTNNDDSSEVIKKYNIPTVALDRKIASNDVISYVEANNYEGGKIATKHLLECGCKNIVFFVGDEKLSSSRERLEGYNYICDKYTIKKQIIQCGYNYKDGLKAIETMLDIYDNIDGIIASNDMVAISSFKALNNKGYKVPDDIQIIGFDNIKFSEFFTPEITTISQPIKEMGKLSARIIIEQKSNLNINKENIFEVKLIERKTTRRKFI